MYIDFVFDQEAEDAFFVSVAAQATGDAVRFNHP